MINWKQMQPFRLWFHQVFLRSKKARNPLKVGLHSYLQIGLKGSKQLRTLQKLACTFLYQMGIQFYDQISTLRIWLKVKLHHSISLRFGLKEGKIALNIMKFFMHSYITRNLTKICVHAYLPKWAYRRFR